MANQTVTVLEADGTTQTDVEVLGVGRQAATASKSVALSTDDKAVLDLVATAAKQDTGNTSLASIDTKLSTIDGRVDGLEALITSTNSKLDGIDTSVDAVKTSVDSAAAGSIAAGTALIGKTAAGLATDAIYNGATALTPKYAKIAASSSGNNTLVTAVTSKKIRVLAYNIMANGAVNAKFQDGAGGTDLTGLKYFDAAGAGISVPFNPVGWFETTANTLLNLNLSGAIATGGELVYVEV